MLDRYWSATMTYKYTAQDQARDVLTALRRRGLNGADISRLLDGLEALGVGLRAIGRAVTP